MSKIFANKLMELRKSRGVSQKELAQALNKRGINVTNQAVSKWESGASIPSAVQLLILCDILEIRDINGVFLGNSIDVFQGLNEEGRNKIIEYSELIKNSGDYDDLTLNRPRGTKLRKLAVYDLELARGKGSLLDLQIYEKVTVGHEVPLSANFGVRISGDSMLPDFENGQIVYFEHGNKIEHGELGLFIYQGNAYFKRLRDRVGGMRLQCLDANYPDIIVANPENLIILGKLAK